MGDKNGLCLAPNNLGSVYEDWGKYEPAIEYYKREQLPGIDGFGLSLKLMKS
jgi:hypothetical protein